MLMNLKYFSFSSLSSAWAAGSDSILSGILTSKNHYFFKAMKISHYCIFKSNLLIYLCFGVHRGENALKA